MPAFRWTPRLCGSWLVVVLTAPEALAQQSLYACAAHGDFVEVLGYASTPTLRTVPRDPALAFPIIFAEDIGILRTTGMIFVNSLGLGGALTTQIHPVTGEMISQNPNLFCEIVDFVDADLNGVMVGAAIISGPVYRLAEARPSLPFFKFPD